MTVSYVCGAIHEYESMSSHRFSQLSVVTVRPPKITAPARKRAAVRGPPVYGSAGAATQLLRNQFHWFLVLPSIQSVTLCIDVTPSKQCHSTVATAAEATSACDVGSARLSIYKHGGGTVGGGGGGGGGAHQYTASSNGSRCWRRKRCRYTTV